MRRTWIVCACLGALFACSDPPETVDDTPDSGLPDTGMDVADAAPDAQPDAPDTPDAEPDVPPVLDPVGQLAVVRWQSDHFFAWSELHAHAMFWPEPVEKDVHDAVAWARSRTAWDVYAPVGGWTVPELGFWDFDNVVSPTVDDIQGAHAGDSVTVGEFVSAGLDGPVFEDLGISVYDSLLEDGYLAEQMQPMGEAMDIRIDGGDDIGAFLAADAVVVPEPIVLTSHDPSAIVPIRAGRDIVVQWEISEDPDDDFFILLDNAINGFLWNIGDGGEANISEILEGGSFELEEDAFLILGRRTTSWVQLPEGRLQVRASTYQWLYLRHVGAYEIEPRIWPAGQTTKVRFTAWDGDATGALTVDAGDGVEIANIRAIDRGNAEVVADVTVQEGVMTGPRNVQILSEGQPIANARGGAWIVEPLDAAGDCESALDEEVPDGAWFATLDGQESGVFDGSECAIGDPTGPEQGIPVELEAGQTLHARLITEGFGATMYVVPECGAITLGGCTEFPTFSFGAELRYTATEAETAILVVDAFVQEPGRARYAVDIRRDDPTSLVVTPDQVAAGVSTEVRVHSVGAPFGDDAALDFGDGVTITELTVDGGQARATLEVAAEASGTRSLTATLSDGQATVADALSIRGTLPQLDCPTALDSEAVGPGAYVGSSASGFTESESPELCPDASVGEEVFHKVDLGPGETLQALVETPGFNSVLYILVECGDDAVRCSDFGFTGTSEFVSWTAPAEGASVLLVVDGVDEFDQGDYTLHVRVHG